VIYCSHPWRNPTQNDNNQNQSPIGRPVGNAVYQQFDSFNKLLKRTAKNLPTKWFVANQFSKHKKAQQQEIHIEKQIENTEKKMKILMVCAEYPPMAGGIGRYTANLTENIRKLGFDVYVACDEKGDGHYTGISPSNQENSSILLKIANDLKPDIIHVQFDVGLYGLIFDQKRPKKVETYIDRFYNECKTPIVTTFHSGKSVYFGYVTLESLLKKEGRMGFAAMPVRLMLRLWRYSLNYLGVNNIYGNKLRKSHSGIVFSHFMSKKLCGGRCKVIYHGSEPAVGRSGSNKAEARKKLSIPEIKDDERIALAVGFTTDGKGWELLEKIKLPKGWKLVVNSSKSHFNNENIKPNWDGSPNIIDLQRGYLGEEELSTLFYASDAVILPYKAASGSGVMFDALAHGLPFIATDLEFFKEFAAHGLGIAVKRNPSGFSKALGILAGNYDKYQQAVNKFKGNIKWSNIAKEHSKLYNHIAERASISESTT
jgi:glycosyltransferase involved in cell wall biosynthesis